MTKRRPAKDWNPPPIVNVDHSALGVNAKTTQHALLTLLPHRSLFDLGVLGCASTGRSFPLWTDEGRASPRPHKGIGG